MKTLTEHFCEDLKIPLSLAKELEKYHWDCLTQHHSLDNFYKFSDGLRESLKKHDHFMFIEINRLVLEKEAKEKEGSKL